MPPGSQHPVDLRDDLVDRGDVVNDAVRVDEVERPIRKGQVGRALFEQLALEPVELEAATGEP